MLQTSKCPTIFKLPYRDQYLVSGELLLCGVGFRSTTIDYIVFWVEQEAAINLLPQLNGGLPKNKLHRYVFFVRPMLQLITNPCAKIWYDQLSTYQSFAKIHHSDSWVIPYKTIVTNLYGFV